MILMSILTQIVTLWSVSVHATFSIKHVLKHLLCFWYSSLILWVVLLILFVFYCFFIRHCAQTFIHIVLRKRVKFLIEPHHDISFTFSFYYSSYMTHNNSNNNNKNNDQRLSIDQRYFFEYTFFFKRKSLKKINFTIQTSFYFLLYKNTLYTYI